MSNMYLELMRQQYPNFKDCTILTFDDSKQGRDLVRVLDQHKYTDDQLEKGLQAYNEKGAGIFFSVNSMKPGERSQKDVTHINSRICEVDDLSKEDQLKLISVCPVKPSLIIESKKSYHMYWFAKDGTKENWNKICWGLRNFFSGDSAVIDISRVLRIPGYNHLKDEREPYMCTVADGDGAYHTEEEMLNAYPDTETLSEKEARATKKEQQLKQAMGDNAWDRIRAMDSKSMLERISGTSLTGGEVITFKHNSNGTEQIYCNGRSTGCRLDKNGKIGSTKKGGPNWTNWVAYYGSVDWKEIYQWIKEEFPFVLPEKPSLERVSIASKEIPSPTIIDTYSDSINMDNKVPFTWGLPVLDDKLGRIDYGKFVAALGESGAGKTTYTFFQALKNAELGYKTCYISLEVSPQELITNKCLRRYGVTNRDWDNKTINEEVKRKMNEMYKQLINYPNLYLVQIQNPSISSVGEFIREKKKEGYYLFYIDNLGILLSDKGSSKEYDIVTEASRYFMLLAHEEKVTIILLHHFDQGNAATRALPRDLSSIRGGAKLEHDADIIFQVWRDLSFDGDANLKNQTTILVQKNRFWGTVQGVNIKFNKGEYEEIKDGGVDPY